MRGAQRNTRASACGPCADGARRPRRRQSCAHPPLALAHSGQTSERLPPDVVVCAPESEVVLSLVSGAGPRAAARLARGALVMDALAAYGDSDDDDVPQLLSARAPELAPAVNTTGLALVSSGAAGQGIVVPLAATKNLQGVQLGTRRRACAAGSSMLTPWFTPLPPARLWRQIPQSMWCTTTRGLRTCTRPSRGQRTPSGQTASLRGSATTPRALLRCGVTTAHNSRDQRAPAARCACVACHTHVTFLTPTCATQDAHVGTFVFDEQYNTFHAYGYGVEPSGHGFVGNADALISRQGARNLTSFRVTRKEYATLHVLRWVRVCRVRLQAQLYLKSERRTGSARPPRF